MGNTCNTIKPGKQQQLITTFQSNKQLSNIQNLSNTSSSKFQKQINKILQQTQMIQDQYPKASLKSIYLLQKVLIEQKTEEKIIQKVMRKQYTKGRLFLHQNELKSQNDENVIEQSLKHRISQQQVKQISRILENHFLFLQLNQCEKNETIKRMVLSSTQKEKFVFKEGDKAEHFYIILQGQVEVIIHDKKRKKLKKGQSFGQIALLYGSKRSASVKAITNCTFSRIDRITFKRVVEQITSKTQKQNRQFLQKTDFFNFLTPLQQQSVMNAIITLKYHQDEIIINEGDDANAFYIIKTGSVEILKEKQQSIILKAGNQFGQKSLQEQKSRRTATVKAITQTILISIGRNQIVEALGTTVKNIMIRNRIKMASQKSKRFQILVRNNFQQIVETTIIRSVSKDQKLLKKGHIMKYIYIPFDIQFYSVSKVYTFGSIIQQNLLIQGKPLSHGVTAQNDGYVLLIKISSNFLNSYKNLPLFINPQSLKLQNIKVVKKIGQGQFGQVFACIHTQSNTVVAIKSVSKKTIEKYQLQKQINNEQLVMKNIEHPFIMKYYHTFVNKKDVYFALEYVSGKELFDVIREIGLLNSQQAQFYVGQILLALQHLHNKNIIYRDLKPENIMVDKSGYLKVIDMGTAKELRKQFYYKTRTMIGTPHYMSPEAISGKGYSFLADLWSLGVVLYQFVCGFLPFQQQNSDPYQIFKLIMHSKIQFPQYIQDNNAKQLILQLLSIHPKSRINKGYHQIKSMNFFSNLNWSQLHDKTLIPPYLSRQTSQICIQNTDLESLQLLQSYFQKRGSKENIQSSNKKQIRWEANLK